MLIQREHTRAKPTPKPWPAGKAKPKLAVSRLPIYRVHYTVLEEYLARVYNMRGFDFCLATGAAPGLVPEYRVSAILPNGWNAPEQADRIRCGQRTKNVALILNVLCIDGFIPPGLYIIDTRQQTPVIDVYRTLLEETRDPLDPRCIEYRNRHRDDHDFNQKAAILDAALLKWLKDQRRESL